MRLYREDDAAKLKRTIRNTVIGLCALLALTVVATVLICQQVQKSNYGLIQFINTCLSVICAFTVIYKVDTVIVASARRLKHYKDVESAQKTEICGTVLDIGDAITVIVGLKSKEICLKDGRRTYSCYLLEDFDCNFEVGDEVQFTIAKKHITESLVIEKSQ